MRSGARGRDRAPSRGQSATELALTMLVGVTVLSFGVHFAEVGYLSLKVQQAVASALFDSTGVKMHVLKEDADPIRTMVPLRNWIDYGAGPAATARYGNFGAKNGNLTHVFTRADNLQVKCWNEPSFRYDALASFSSICDSKLGGLACSASGDLYRIRIPSSFAEDQGGFFAVKNVSAQHDRIRVCANGRVCAGDCCPAYSAILLDEWAWAGVEEAHECKVLDGKRCENKPYRRAVELLHRSKGSAASDLARALTNGSPMDENEFHFGFRGEESSFKDKENGGDALGPDPEQWHVTPGGGSPTQQYDDSYGRRTTCFLGLEC